MKTFVYSKRTNKKVAVITNVAYVKEPDKNSITFVTTSGEEFTFNTKNLKTTTYQN